MALLIHNLTQSGIGPNVGGDDDDDAAQTPSEHHLNLNGSGKNSDATGPLITLFVPLFMFATGVLGNLVALTLLWRSRRDHSRSVFYRLVSGLALTDLLGTLATSPVTILVYSNDRQWVGGQATCDYFSFMMIFSGLATVLVVGCLAVERFLAILHPYVYEVKVSPRRANWALLGVWLISAFISCLPLMTVGRNVRHWPGTWCFFDFYSDRMVDQIFAFFFAIIGLIVIVATAVCNVAVMIVLLRMRRISQNIGKSREGRTLNMTSEMQMIFFLAGIILVFAACYSPLMIRIVLNVTGAVVKDVEWDLLAIRLASVNQILDPWVYLLFRRRLAGLLYSACKSVSPLHTLSSLKALRGGASTPDLSRGTSIKGVTGLRFSPTPNGLHSPPPAATPPPRTPSDSSPGPPPPRSSASDRQEVFCPPAEKRAEPSSVDAKPVPPRLRWSSPEGESLQDGFFVVSVQADGTTWLDDEVVVVEGSGSGMVVVVGQGDGMGRGDSSARSCLVSRGSLTENGHVSSDPEGGRMRKTRFENPALCLEGDDWEVLNEGQRCSQQKRSPQPTPEDNCPTLRVPNNDHQLGNNKETDLGRPAEKTARETRSPGQCLHAFYNNGKHFNPLRVAAPQGFCDCGGGSGSNKHSKAECDTANSELTRKIISLTASLGIPSTRPEGKTPGRRDNGCRPSTVAKLTTSASWPVICRHGNQTVVKRERGEEDVEEREEPVMTDCLPVRKKRHSHMESDCFPLLKYKRHSQVDPPCKQCQFLAGQPFTFV